MNFRSKQRIIFEQLKPGSWTIILCLWCGQPGATQAHHWLVKRNGNVPDEICDQSINLVLLCPQCHQRHGQSKEMTTRCWLHKEKLGYNPAAWLEKLEIGGLIKTVADYYRKEQ